MTSGLVQSCIAAPPDTEGRANMAGTMPSDLYGTAGQFSATSATQHLFLQ
ncbi:hypothetical protein SAMN05421882_100617 [Nitrosomonas communis]|uniref:Uncharacterized protein n=1 Tax=Nitrosomonas communis TaxID=44574 RepID=A0A1H2S3C8_9PROT|nr:hypothetical protein SAMN05421882_100617 [Nitrosomonas communis]